jgi:hypothetical protein
MAAAGRKSEGDAAGFFAAAGRDAAGPVARFAVVAFCAAGLMGLGGLKAGPFRRAVLAAFGGIVNVCNGEGLWYFVGFASRRAAPSVRQSPNTRSHD